MSQCKEEKYGPSGQYPVQCDLPEGHPGSHRVIENDGAGCVLLLWPIQTSPTPLDIISGEFADLLEATPGNGIDDLPKERMERLAVSLEQIGRSFAAQRLRKAWKVHHQK